jgi:hypothetical protein
MTDEAGKTPTNNDLVWGLEGIKQRQLAIDFVMQFANRLCIYSGAVEKLYTNYDLIFPPAEDHSMVVIPNQEAYHDTFSGLNKEAVIDTHFDIIPGEMIGKTWFYFRMPFEGDEELSTYIPFQVGVEHMIKNSGGQQPLIPVLVRGNLREFKLKNPYLHLHSINLDKIKNLSDFEKKDIQRAVWGRLEEMVSELPPHPDAGTKYDLSRFFGPS